MKKLLILLVVASSVATARADAIFEASFAVSVTPPRGLNIGQVLRVEVISGPQVIDAVREISGNADVTLSTPRSTLIFNPLFLSLTAGASGFAKKPFGSALGVSGGQSYTLRFTNILSTAFENIKFDVDGSPILLAKASGGDLASAFYSVGVIVQNFNGRPKGGVSNKSINQNAGY